MADILFLPSAEKRARLLQTTQLNASAQMTTVDVPAEKAAGGVFHLHHNKQHRYEQLVKHFHADVYRYGFWLCKDPDIAQDLTQETFLRAWKSLDSLLEPAAAKAWLITILRRENARRFERKQFDYDSDTEQDQLIDIEQTSTEQHCENDKLRRQLASLPMEYREPLVMQALGGFNSDEIAGLLQLNVNTVNTRLFRARKLLRNILQSSAGTQYE